MGVDKLVEELELQEWVGAVGYEEVAAGEVVNEDAVGVGVVVAVEELLRKRVDCIVGLE